ncbi:hypothetical protein CALVIDRAFT_484053, partial [Calocera viscosa TUFC12733]
RLGALASDEAMVYTHIQNAGNEGIWTKSLKAKLNMHATVINRCLKQLEQRQLVKSVKNVKYPTRKTYMLFNLKPSVELTGGPWFNDNELDVGFIEGLLQAVYTFIEKKTFIGDNYQVWPTSRTDKYPTLSDIRRFVHTSGLTEVKLEEEHVKSLLDVLVYDGQVESLPGSGMGGWEEDEESEEERERSRERRKKRKRTYSSGLTEVPCGVCEVFDFCAPKGPVNARDCNYYDDWLLPEKTARGRVNPAGKGVKRREGAEDAAEGEETVEEGEGTWDEAGEGEEGDEGGGMEIGYEEETFEEYD